MIEVISGSLPLLFLACAPALLVIHFFRPRLMPWPILLLCASCVGWALLVLSEHFDEIRYAHCLGRRSGQGAGPFEVIDPECPLTFVDGVNTYTSELGWLWALLYLTPWLAIYGVVQVILKRVNGARHA